MRKVIILVLVVIVKGFSQNPEIKSELPIVIPPSPTVAALMKFEEIPVNNYTGIPDVSVPLISLNTLNKNVNINLGLNYHPLSIKLKEVSSDIGLGWALSGTGTITRNVRDIPDEMKEINSRFGIYRSNDLSNNLNYYDAMNIAQSTMNTESAINIITSSTPDLLKEFLWESNVKGKYDTKHDLWQYNFFGYSGRFYIEKNITNNKLEVKLLDDNNLKIINHYNEDQNSPNYYEPLSFTIVNDYGIKFFFDVVEETNSSSFDEKISFNGTINNTINSYVFKSSFHLTKIFDNNDNLLVDYIYLDAGQEHLNQSMNEVFGSLSNFDIIEDINSKVNIYSPSFSPSFILDLFKPYILTSTQSNIYNAKKIQEINVLGVGKILFNYQTGREDDDYINKDNVKILKEISLYNQEQNLVKKFSLNHTYKNALKRKLFLDEILMFDNNNLNFIKYYDFNYKDPNGLVSSFSEDYWGFLNSRKATSFGHEREVKTGLVDAFVLEKISTPTGGDILFEYESNTYSNIVDQELDNFDDNPYNWDSGLAFANFNSISNNLTSLVNSSKDLKNIRYTVQIDFPTEDWWFVIYKDFKSSENIVQVINYASIVNENGFYIGSDLISGDYYVEFFINDPPTGINNFSATLTMFYETKKTTNYLNFMYGGGIRIAQIKHYEKNFNENFPNDNLIKTLKYDYNDFSDVSKSSGVLNSQKPIFYYETEKFVPELRISYQGGSGWTIHPERNNLYSSSTDYNKLNSSLTKGGFVGYKNVKIYETNKGYTKEYYSTSLEYPDIEKTLFKLYLPKRSMDYKRGLLLKKEIFDNNNRLLESIENQYSFIENNYLSGLYVFSTYDNGYNVSPSYKLMNNYNHLVYIFNNNCAGTPDPCALDYVQNIIKEDLNLGYAAQLDINGWARLDSRINKKFFYKNSVQESLEIVENFTYNTNMKIISQGTFYSTGEAVVNNFSYANDLNNQMMIDKNMIGIPLKTESVRNGELLSVNEIIYKDWGNNFLAPELIKTAKGNLNAENRIKYNQYDSFGNPLEVQQEGGMLISYIWGYNKTQPVAKLENIAYNSIPSSHIQAIETASNANNEANLISALNALRNDPVLSDAMVTTYTYKPLVGVSSITDPKGNTITYHYDSFGRLEFVKDKDGNILSENEYHYRTQN